MAVITCDTRQQAGKHETKHKWFEDHGFTLARMKLDFGDYMTPGSNVSVDTKRNLRELVQDVGRDHARFGREMDRARDAGYRLVILTETSAARTLDDVNGWVNDTCRRCMKYRMHICDPSTAPVHCLAGHKRPMQGPQLAKCCATMAKNHGCVFEFVHPRDSARRICELLGLGVSEDGDRYRG